ncbi:patatin-like phospholipase family protein [Acuticoccus sp. MNP-M23]|uniref:patatin-like phospholipase family protein n=1 Tax=Acuticoccus sp. MNP-M23 TaxID=3072793 RepID=UPI0028151206|nr:patatin-like phospholipase family protein [Acuticoccus sp. MNP-M23]WMS44379.1 patatin-like phospholipase family protein [Acuticoccus sp. MNP-M23]
MAPKKINVALQGGGAHGAFTWGVLTVLLESDEVAIDGVTGTSAGAMNAAVMMSGYMKGGKPAAIAALRAFWFDTSEAARFSPLRRSAMDMLMGNWSLDASPAYIAMDIASRLVSPAIANPLGINPLSPIVDKHVDFSLLKQCIDLKLFVAATNVRNGRVRIFPHSELTPDALLASACIPQMFAPVVIDGEAYWDGGFMGNPPLYPLFYETDTADTVIVQINPVERTEIPFTAREIVNRVNEITFNASLLKELRAVRFVTRLIEEGKLHPEQYMRVRLHRIAAEELRPLSASSKMNAEWEFLEHLYKMGRRAAEHWLERHLHDIGERDTLDLDEELD